MHGAVARARPRLLWVNHFAVTPGEGGTTRHFELGRELGRRGWRVTVAASDFTYQRRRYTRRQSEGERAPIPETLDEVQLLWLWAAAYDRNDWRRAWNWLSFGRSLLQWGRARGSTAVEGRPDVVIGSSPSLFAALAAHRLARRWRVPFVLEVRDIWPESLLAVGGRRGPGYLVLAGVARYLYRRADRVVVLARGTAQHLQKIGIPESRIDLVPNGVDAATFHPRTAPEPASDAEAGSDPNPETFTLAYTGAHGPANGLDVVLDAAEALKDRPRIRFLLVGDGPAKAELMESARQRRLDNVEFHRPVAKEDLPTILERVDAGLMVLRDADLFAYGVSPNKLFDYCAASLPVVCNVPGEVAGMVQRAGAGEQAESGSGAALAEAILRLEGRSAQQRHAMGQSGREWVVREHDRPVVAARLDEILRPLVAS